MKRGPHEHADEQGAHAPDQDLAEHQELARTRSRPAEREPLTSTRSPGPGHLLEQRRGLLRRGHGVGSPRGSPRRRPAPRAPTGTSTSIPQRGRVLPDRPVEVAREPSPSSAMVPSTAIAALGRAGGEVVEGGAHRHRVGVVAVVHDRQPRPGAPPPGHAARRSARPPGPPRPRPSALAAATAASVFRRLWGSVVGQVQLHPLAARLDLGPARAVREQLHLSPGAERPGVEVVAQVRPPAAAHARAARRRRRAGGRGSARPWPRPRARPCASSARCTGPTFTITPTSGSAMAASSAISPSPRMAISSTTTSVPRRRLEQRQRQPDLGVQVLAVGVRGHLRLQERRRGCPWWRSCRWSR